MARRTGYVDYVQFSIIVMSDVFSLERLWFNIYFV